MDDFNNLLVIDQFTTLHGSTSALFFFLPLHVSTECIVWDYNVSYVRFIDWSSAFCFQYLDTTQYNNLMYVSLSLKGLEAHKNPFT